MNARPASCLLALALVLGTLARLPASAATLPGGAGGAVRVRDLGELGAAAPVRVGFMLRDRHENELAALIRMQGDRTSPYYHRYLTNRQWNDYYAPDAGTYARTVALLASRGFRVDDTFENRGMIRATAPAAVVERYFGTRLHAVLQDGYGLRHRNVVPARMPAELRQVAVAFAGLDSTVHVREPHEFGPARGRAPALAEASAVTPDAVSTSTPGPNPSPDPTLSPTLTPEDDYASDGGYGPAIWAKLYDFPVQHGYGGRGEAVGSVINGDYATSDARAENKYYAVPRTGRQLRVYTDGKFAASLVSEATLDGEVLETMAPASDFYEYIAQSFDELGIEGAYEKVVSQNLVAVLNSSFGSCETDDPSFEYATNYVAMEGAAKGITFVAAAGDLGALGCGYEGTNGTTGTEVGVDVPCADTYFVCVGGTEFLPTASTLGYVGEMAWTSGGGGVSVLESLPDWQSSTPNVVTSGRNVPDLALTADALPPGVCFVIVYEGTIQGAGGTSVASPMFVALQAEIDEAQHSRNGFVNERLYMVGNHAETFAFRDVVAGSNGLYMAKSGYDDTTGFGSPLGFELAGAE
jgi:subtilase family serine protease